MISHRSNKSFTSISSEGLKIIACLSMLTDHFFRIVYYRYMQLPVYFGKFTGKPQDDIFYSFGRTIGRMAFVLFAFSVSQGMKYTRSRKNYIIRLFVTALITEPIFDLAFDHQMGFSIGISHQNVLFTLCFGAVLICLLEMFEKNMPAKITCVIICSVISFLLYPDYSFFGILVIVIMYFFESDIYKMGAYSIFVLCIGSFVELLLVSLIEKGGRILTTDIITNFLFAAVDSEFMSVLGFLPILYYDKSKGRGIPKIVFYLFYPVHLLALFMIRETLL